MCPGKSLGIPLSGVYAIRMPVADPDLAGVLWDGGGREAPPYPD